MTLAKALSAQEIVDLNRQYTLFEWSRQDSVAPLPVQRAEGVYFWDADGQRYLDFNSMLMCVNIGHGNRHVIQAMKAQLDQFSYVSPFMATEVRGRLGLMLTELAPGDLGRPFFTNGGAEANENAIKAARFFTGRHKIIARYKSYHGATAGAISLTGDPRRWASEPAIPGVVRVMDPYRYRCRWCASAEHCNLNCLNHVEDVIQYEGPHTIAAMIVEPVTGTNGIIVPPQGYLRGLRELTRRHGILLIADEVMSGFGRTGEWFAVDHWNVVPDIMTVAKGLTSAYAPLGAMLVSQEIAEHFEDHVFWGGLTYNSHALGLAAGIANIEVYRSEDLISRAREMGKRLGRGLEELKAKHPSVGDVRYIGLFAIVEVVRNRETRAPMAPFNAQPGEMGPMAEVARFFKENGLYTFVRWNTFFANPPLIISEEQLNEGLGIFDEALEITDRAVEG